MLPPIRHAIPLSPAGGRALAAELAEADARREATPEEQQLAETAREQDEARRRIASGTTRRATRAARTVGV